jgi:serine phosphatase RsbU (regulator of sigma subunit)/ligand-binding sensor domain-containing protein
VFPQSAFEKGYIPVTNYIANKHFKGLAQNWVITQDNQGLIYVGNNQNLLQYDGEEWRLIDVKDGSTVRGLLHYRQNIYVGTLNDFGVLQYNAQGKAFFKSLKTSKADIGQVWNVFAVDDEIVFRTTEQLFYYHLKTGKTSTLTLPYPRDVAYQVGKAIICAERDDKALWIENKSLRELYYPEFTEKNKYIKSVINYNQQEYLFIPSYGPFYKVDKQKLNLSPYPVLSEQITDRLFFEHSLLYNKNLLIGTKNAGFIELNEQQQIVHFYNTTTQLQDDYVHYTFVDHQGNVWLALNNGISTVKIKDELSFFDKSYGLEGIVEAITRFDGRMTLATHSGFYIMNTRKDDDMSSINDLKPRFSHVQGKNVSTQCWALLPVEYDGKKTLLGISNNGLHEVTTDLQPKLVKSCEAYSLVQSKTDPKLIYLGLADGVFAMYYTNGIWKEEGYIYNTSFRVNGMTEWKDQLWLGSYDEGVCVNYNLNTKKAFDFDSKQGLPKGQITIKLLADDLLFGTEMGLYRYNAKTNHFFKDEVYNPLLSDSSSYIHRVSVDTQNRLWLITYDHIHKKIEIGFFSEYQGKMQWNSAPFNEIEEGDVHSIFHDQEGITWLGGQNGLFRFDEKSLKRYRAPFNTQIRKVESGDSVLFWGHYLNPEGNPTLTQGKQYQPTLDFEYNSLTFHFAAQDYENNDSKVYSYFLDGYSKQWSAYSRENKAVFTNLPEGKYTFKVKTKNRHEMYSESAGYTFTILPPWYRTWWAYLTFLILAGLGVFGVVYLYTKNLREIIQERTAEIREQKDVIEEKNKDILSSIDYAQKIQQALLPSNEILRNIFTDSFVVFMPRDVVSGDFYWAGKKSGNTCFALMDCTGHGVPGAFMSMIGNALLNELILEKGITMPAIVLDSMRNGIIKSLSQHNDEHRRDGMDAGLCALNPDTLELQYSGANIALYIFRANDRVLKTTEGLEMVRANDDTTQQPFIYEIKPDKMPVGYFDEVDRPFNNHSLQLEKGDRIYLFSDGYPDQFGGEKGKKYKRGALLKYLSGIQNGSLSNQKTMLEAEFFKWKGELEQVDDVTLLAVEV